MENIYDEGRAAHAAGTELTANPYLTAPRITDWAAGWSDAQAQAADTPPTDTSEETSDETPGSDGPAESPTETVGGPSDSVDVDVDGPGIEEPLATDVVDSLGAAGYDRIMDLLSNPPVADVAVGPLPVDGEVPDDLSEWLEAWKAPLAFVAVDTAIAAVKTRLSGTSRGRLKELYRGMSPMALTAAMQANAETITEFADQRVAEAGIISSLQASVTQKAASFLLNALLLV